MTTKCGCGGALRAARLDRFDFTPLAGLPVSLIGAPGLRCSKCGGATLEGEVISSVMHGLALLIARETERLSSDRARFLRKYLRLTQQALAERMGIARETVADWERGENVISPQHDLMLRAIIVAEMMGAPGKAPKPREVVEAISAARLAEPARASDVVIDLKPRASSSRRGPAASRAAPKSPRRAAG